MLEPTDEYHELDKLFNDASTAYVNSDDMTASITFDKAAKLAIRLSRPEIAADCFFFLASLSYEYAGKTASVDHHLNLLHTATLYLEEAKTQVPENPRANSLDATIKYTLGLLYLNQDDYTLALRHFSLARNCYEASNNLVSPTLKEDIDNAIILTLDKLSALQIPETPPRSSINDFPDWDTPPKEEEYVPANESLNLLQPKPCKSKNKKRERTPEKTPEGQNQLKNPRTDKSPSIQQESFSRFLQNVTALNMPPLTTNEEVTLGLSPPPPLFPTLNN